MNDLPVSCPSIFVGIHPVSKTWMGEFSPQTLQIHDGKHGELSFIPILAKTKGLAIGSICRKQNDERPLPKNWIAKVGRPMGSLRNDPVTIHKRKLTDINEHTILEKIATDLYKELAQRQFGVPKTRLALIPLLDEFTSARYPAAQVQHKQGITHTLRTLSRVIEDYQDFATISTTHEQETLSFLDYIQHHHRPPAMILRPDGTPVPLFGFCELLAVGRVMADTDILGETGNNAGIHWIHDIDQTIIAAQTVKLNIGGAFQFVGEDGVNWAINKRRLPPHPLQLADLKDLQINSKKSSLRIEWGSLTPSQQESFLSSLLNCARYLQSDDILQFMFFRDGKFNRTPTECISEEIATEMAEEMRDWMRDQLEIYQQEIRNFRFQHPEYVLRMHYLDQCGTLLLPTQKETFLLKTLFTSPSLVSAQEQNVHEKEVDHTQQAIVLNQLFAPVYGQSIQKVLLTGPQGIGNTTLCQQIANGWASDQLFQGRFKAVYSISLPDLNMAAGPGGILDQLDSPDRFLARAIATFVLHQPELEDSLLQQLCTHRREILVLIDGYETAPPPLRSTLTPLLEDPEIHVILTARPDDAQDIAPHFQHIVENLGFSDNQIETYCYRFFNRKENSILTKQRQQAFLKALEEDAYFRKIAHNPRQLEQLCTVWEREERMEIRESSNQPKAEQISEEPSSSLMAPPKQVTDVQLEALIKENPNLTSLDLSKCTKVSDTTLEIISKHLPHLTKLDLWKCKITDNGLLAISRGCHKLEVVNLRNCDNITSKGLIALSKQISKTLTEINLYKCLKIENKGFIELSKNCRKLTRVNLYDCYKITDNVLAQFSKNCSQLKTIDLSRCWRITDEGLTALLINSPEMTSVILNECNKITDAALKALIKEGKNISEVGLRKCWRITGKGIFAYKNQKPKVIVHNGN